MQVIGLCRFSYPALGGFQIEHETAEQRAAFLYSPERMDERFRQFEALSLPSIAAQSEPNFTFVIVIGDDLPERYQERLFDLCASVPQVVIQPHPAGGHREVMQKAFNTARQDTGGPCLQFRHDDDDALGVQFVERFRSAATDCKPLLERSKFVAFNFARGYIARADAKGLHVEETFHPFWGVALGISVAPHIRKSIMNFAHGRINRFMPALSFDDPPMYVRGHNDFNDSRQGTKVTQPNLKLLDAQGEQRFKADFGIDSDRVREIFAP